MAVSTRNWRAHSHQKSCMVTTTRAPEALAAGTSPAPSDCREWKWTTSGATTCRWARNSSVTAGLCQLRSSSQAVHGVVVIQCTARPVSSVSSQALSGSRSPSQPAYTDDSWPRAARPRASRWGWSVPPLVKLGG